MTVAFAGAIDDGNRDALHATCIQAIEHMRDQRPAAHGVFPATVCLPPEWTSSVMRAIGNARENASKVLRARSALPSATGNDKAHTEDRGTRPHNTSHACSNLVSTGDAVQRLSTQYQYHTKRGPAASVNRSSLAETRIPPGNSRSRRELASMRARAGS